MLEAALDTSAGTAFALQEDGKLIASHYRPFEPRSTQEQLEPWLHEILQEHSLTFSSVVRWTVGLGPGSFTGIRIALAFVKGVTAVSAAGMQGAMTAYALAAQASLDLASGSRIGVLNDARCGQLALTGFRKEKTGLTITQEPYVPDNLNSLQLLEDFQRLATFDIEAATARLPVIHRNKLMAVEELDVRHFFNCPAEYLKTQDPPHTSLSPIYVRPPAVRRPRRMKTNPNAGITTF